MNEFMDIKNWNKICICSFVFIIFWMNWVVLKLDICYLVLCRIMEDCFVLIKINE